MRRNLRVLMRCCLVMVAYICMPNMLKAQPGKTHYVNGTVKDAKGEILIGVTVKVKNSSVATVTNNLGQYKISIKSATDVLQFSYIGYQTVEKSVGAAGTIDIVLSASQSNLNEVVVIAYGSVAKKDATGTVGTVNVKDLQKAPVSSYVDALAGRVAGVQVTSGDGQPGAASTITIRGGNSITQDNSPLYVIDGFPIENYDNNAINPADIASISVLKDASATAIYGSRGANGVIIITTKKGKTGMPTVGYSNFYGYQQVTKRMELMSPYQFVKLQNEIDPTAAASLYFTNGRTLENYRTAEGVDWQNQLFRKGVFQNHNISLNGGSANTKYVISGSLFDQQGAIINSGFKRYQGRVNLEQKINDRFSFTFNTNYSNSTSFGTKPASVTIGNAGANNQYNLLNNVWTYRPVTGGVNDDAILGQLVDPSVDPNNDYRVNPVISAANEYNSTMASSLISNASINYNILKNLKITVRGGVNLNSARQDIFNNSQTRSGSPKTLAGLTNGPNGAIINRSVNDFLNENLITYNKKFGKNAIDLLGGFTIQQTHYNNFGFTANQVPNENEGISGLDEGFNTAMQSLKSQNSLLSYIARANYGYNEKYLFTASFRADGSSKFSPKNRWGYFPSGAFAWRLKQEDFMQNITAISDAKLHVSYGLTGNNRVSDFAYLSTITFPVNNAYAWDNALTKGAIPATLGNSDLKWETTAQTDIGMDLSFFKDRLNLEVDYYKKVTSDLLLNASVPYSTGFATAITNIGKVSNNGLEITINTDNIRGKNFTWSTNFNISFNRNRVLALSDGQESLLTNVTGYDGGFQNIPLYIAKKNQPVAQFYGYVWDGIYQYSDFDKLPNGTYTLKNTVPDNGTARANIKPGDVKYKDINGDGVLNSLDNTVIGNPYPVHIGGFTNNFTYKGFDLSVFLQWSYGNQIYNANRWFLEGGNIFFGENQFATYENRWTPENQSNVYNRVGGYGAKVYSSRYVEDGSFLRLKTISFGYNLSKKMLNKIKIANCRIYASLQNIYTWTKYQGPDPEVSTKDNSPLTPGFDYSPYPRVFTVTGGINVTF